MINKFFEAQTSGQTKWQIRDAIVDGAGTRKEFLGMIMDYEIIHGGDPTPLLERINCSLEEYYAFFEKETS